MKIDALSLAGNNLRRNTDLLIEGEDTKKIVYDIISMSIRETRNDVGNKVQHIQRARLDEEYVLDVWTTIYEPLFLKGELTKKEISKMIADEFTELTGGEGTVLNMLQKGNIKRHKERVNASLGIIGDDRIIEEFLCDDSVEDDGTLTIDFDRDYNA